MILLLADRAAFVALELGAVLTVAWTQIKFLAVIMEVLERLRLLVLVIVFLDFILQPGLPPA